MCFPLVSTTLIYFHERGRKRWQQRLCRRQLFRIVNTSMVLVITARLRIHN